MRTGLGYALLAGSLAVFLVVGYTQTGAVAVPAPTAARAVPSTAIPVPSVAEPEPLGMPLFKLDFRLQAAIPGVAASPVFASPVLCSPDGIPFVDFPQLPDFKTQTVYSLDPKGSHAFSTKSVNGLYDLSFKGFFVADSLVGILVQATKEPKQSQYTMLSQDGAQVRSGTAYKGEHSDFLVEFDRNGNYKSTLDLPAQYKFWRVAALSDGKLLALAYDRPNSVARLLLLDSDGRIVRPLELPAKMLASPELTQGSSGGVVNQARAQSSLSSWLFAPSRDRILLYQAHSAAPLLEVGAGGAVREVPLEAPKGYVLDSLVPANDRWLVRYRREALSDNMQMDARPGSKDFVLYEVNPADGNLRKRIDPGTGPFFNIACEQDGVITAFSMENDKVMRMTADLPR